MILLTYGTRPEYIKIKPIVLEFIKNNIDYKVLFTGQHTNIAEKNFDYSITIEDYSDNRLNNIIINCLMIPKHIFDNIEYILVQGDTTSVLALCINAFNRNIKVIHLEAGLRSFDKYNPFPEEINRKLVSVISDINLCPTITNLNNLLNENIKTDSYIVGNTVLDNLLPYKNKCVYENKVLITMHRRENHDIIHDWFIEINELAKNNKHIEFILPIHPNPNVIKYKDILTDVKVIEPLQHNELIELLVKCKLVITDSGGLQEECSFFNKKCLVCREVTERVETVDKSSFIVKTPLDLKNQFYKHINDYEIFIDSPYGDGNSSKLIVDTLKNYLNYGK